MASVAICPHCYLQLVVPDGIEPNERVECPTCAKEFDIARAVLRAIPEVVRRQKQATVEPVTQADSLELAIEEQIDEVVEIAADDKLSQESDVIEQIKSRIEKELADGNLLPGMSASLPLEPPVEEVNASPADDLAEPEYGAESELLDEWHRPTVRMHELDTTDTQPIRITSNESVVAEAAAPDDLADEAVIADELAISHESIEQAPVAEAETTVDYQRESAPAEPPPLRPTATTLADLMPRANDRAEDYIPREEAIDAPGPSFDLPNVPLMPTNAATVEFDPSMSFGPAAESEFELDQVDFESTPREEPATDDFQAAPDDEMSEADEPVFAEPGASSLPATPYVLPGLPRTRKKRSGVRLLAGVALGGVAGSIGALFALLWILGPDGDFLQVAHYLPNAVLPKSFQSTPAPRPVQSETPTRSESQPAEPENVPATFTEEVKQPENSVASVTTEEPAHDERYGAEPSRLDEPKAEPIAAATAPSDTRPLPIRGPSITIDELTKALDSAQAAQVGLMTGDLSDAAVRRTKGMSYAKLCDLAEAVTFVDPSASPAKAQQAIDDARQLFRATLSNPHTRSEVDRIATIWIGSPHRRHGGVFLAGTLSGGQIAGDVYQYELTTDDQSTLTLLAAEPLDPAVEGAQQSAGIVGSIIEHPADVAGYDGTADRAIWVTQAIPLQ